MKQGTIPTPLDAVVFDMDGTLLDTERLHHEAMAAAATALGYSIDPALFAAMVGVHRELNQAMLVQRLGPEFPVDVFYADADARFAVAASTGIPYRPGVRHLLDRLAADGIRCAVATSTESPRAEERLASTGLLGYFEAVVTRSDVARPKPAPDPYLLAAKRLGVRPEHCLAVEDSLNGIRAAAAAGMATVMVPDLIPPDGETGRLTIATLESLAELEDMLPQRTRPGGRGIGTVIALLLALCTFVLLVMSPAALAQSLPGTAANSTAAATARDPYGRETPRGLADGLVAALAAGDYERASEYFDLSGIARSRRAEQGATYARRLQAALDAGGSLVPFLQLSNEPAGRINDQLPLDEERIGKLPPRAGSANSDGTPLLARAVPQDNGQVWQISASTLAALPAVAAVASGEQDSLRGVLPAFLTQTQVGGAPISDWIILLLMAAGFYLVVRLLFGAALELVRRLKHGHEDSRSWRLLHAASSPLSLYVAVLLFLGATRSLHVAIVARQFVSRYAGAVLLVSFAWFLWRLVDVVADFAAVRMERTQRRRARSILVFARRGVKILLLAFAVVAALGAIGIDVTTGIAALGLGGLALALGAQKTVENIVGSISVIADEPVRVGDFCRVGDVTGTVEDIGIRSTRIRTNERTRVTIPNGNFAALQIENYSLRDRYLFNPTLNLARDLDVRGVEGVLNAVRAALSGAEYLLEGARATLTGIGASSFDVEVFGWINVPDFERSLYLREQLLLDIMRRVAAAGGTFAYPASVVHLEPAGGPQPTLPPPSQRDRKPQ